MSLPIDTIICGDCKEILPSLEEDSIDAIVCDPPYELGFMGRKWDSSGIAYDKDMWFGCLRVLKPGGHLLAFGGTRTYHRMACAIEDAGFEIRDMLEWVYGSGFPKSLDIGKAIDRSIFTTKTSNPDFQIVRAWIRGKVKAAGLTYKQIDTALGNANSHKASHYLDNSQPQLPTPEDWEIIKNLLKLDESLDINRPPKLLIETFEREIIGYRKCNAGLAFTSEGPTELPITKPLSKEAETWNGWGSGLKPSHEPICLARKPLDGCIIAENVLRWSVGGLNIDGCRINPGEHVPGGGPSYGKCEGVNDGWKRPAHENYESKPAHNLGRFPANLILDGSDEVRALFPETKSGDRSGHRNQPKTKNAYGNFDLQDEMPSKGDSGSAARFFRQCPITEEDYDALFYCAKASKGERDGSTHPTMKPLSLMRYLCRLITPPGGLILDPFGGSGTTGLAANQEGFHFTMIEQQPEYCDIARKRIAAIPRRLEEWA